MSGEIQTNRLDVLIRTQIRSDGKINKLFQERTTLLDLINQETPEMIDERGYEFTMNVEPAGPNTYTPEGADFPDSSPLLDVKGRVRYARLQRTLQMTLDTYLHFTKLSDQEIMEKLAGRIDRDMATAKKDHNQMNYGDGSGEVARVIAPIPAGAANATVTFSKTVAGGNTFGAFKIRKNAFYEFRDSTGTQIVGGANVIKSKCLSVDKKAGTAVFDAIPNTGGVVAIAATHRLIPYGTYTYAPYGLDYFFATAGFRQNLSLDNYDALRANIIQAGNQYLSAPILTKLKNAMAYRVEKDQIENLNILYSYAQDHAMNMQGQSIRRATMSDRTYDGSYKDVEFEGQKPTVCPDAPRDKVYRWAKGTISRAELYPFDILEIEGKTVHLAWNNGAAHKGILLMYFFWAGQNFCTNPNTLAGLAGLNLSGLPVGDDV
jgi:hypothetical protein